MFRSKLCCIFYQFCYFVFSQFCRETIFSGGHCSLERETFSLTRSYLSEQVYQLIDCLRSTNQKARNPISEIQFLINAVRARKRRRRIFHSSFIVSSLIFLELRIEWNRENVNILHKLLYCNRINVYTFYRHYVYFCVTLHFTNNLWSTSSALFRFDFSSHAI